MQKFLHELGMFLIDITQTFLIAFGFFLVIYGFIIQPHKVSGGSMESTLHDGELILTNKIGYRFREPARGDVVTFRSLQDPSKDFIKRVIGLPGEKVEIGDNTVKIYNNEQPNGFTLSEPYLDSWNKTEPNITFSKDKAVEIPLNEYMVMGDNRQNSFDSRAWGPIPKENIIGEAWFVYWPFNRMGFQPEHRY